MPITGGILCEKCQKKIHAFPVRLADILPFEASFKKERASVVHNQWAPEAVKLSARQQVTCWFELWRTDQSPETMVHIPLGAFVVPLPTVS